MSDLPDNLEGLRIRYRIGMESRSTRVLVDRGKKLHTEDGVVKRSAVIQVLPDPRPYTGPGLTREVTREVPESPIERSVREVAEGRQRRRKGRVPRDEAYLAEIRKLPCAWCGKPGPSRAHHWPVKGSGGSEPDDRLSIPLCDDCHTGKHGVHSGKGLGSMTPEQTKAWQWEQVARHHVIVWDRVEERAA